MASERLAWLRPIAGGNGALMTLFGLSFRPIAWRQRDLAMAFDQDAGSPLVLWVLSIGVCWTCGPTLSSRPMAPLLSRLR
jgi:hypothetical protein